MFEFLSRSRGLLSLASEEEEAPPGSGGVSGGAIGFGARSIDGGMARAPDSSK